MTPARAILYYRDPMHPSYVSNKPGIAPDCGMALEPVYADSQDSFQGAGRTPGMVSVSPEKQRLLGLVVGRVDHRSLTKTIRVLGHVTPEEPRTFPLNAGADGVVRKVFAGWTDTWVKKGQPLVSVYGREYLTGQRTFLYALRALHTDPQTATPDILDQPSFAVEEARLNLLDMGFGEAQVEQIMRDRKPTLDVLLVAPASGIILTRNVFPEQRFNRGTELFRVADLSQVWISADVFGDDIQYIRQGAPARVLTPAAPAKQLLARVTDAQPRFDATTQTLEIRLEAPNPTTALLPDMPVDVELSVTVPNILSVPADAVLDSGSQKTVFVAAGNGNFEPRPVETGSRFEDRVQILKGLQPGDLIVSAGNFLLDSESRMRSSR